MTITYVDFITDKVLLAGVDTDAVPPDNSMVILPEENGFRRVMASEWRVVQKPCSPVGYYKNVVFCFLTDVKGQVITDAAGDDVEDRMAQAWRDTSKIDNGGDDDE